jgi:4-hydroxybenzoate polyprenyltransferase
MLKEKIKAYMDLTRAHFAPVWPLLFISGLMLAFRDYNYFSWSLFIRVFIIGLFGFEAGMVLNDIVDRNTDKLAVDNKFTNYWRPFNERPMSSGIISTKAALVLFFSFVAISVIFIATLPFPNNLYVYIIMIYAYSMEIFYQLKKRNQKFPFAQLFGRTDFLLFPVAGYLCYGNFSFTILLYMIFFYPWALAHLGVNDLADYDNDQAKNIKTITVLYGVKGNATWILVFTLIHLAVAPFFVLLEMGLIALIGFTVGFIILIISNLRLLKNKTPATAFKILPMYHLTLFIYILSIIIDSFFAVPI